MLRINVLFLGPAKDFAGAESASLELADSATVADLRAALTKRYPGLKGAMETIRIAVNEEFAEDDAVLQTGDEAALIPPVSGGTGAEPTFQLYLYARFRCALPSRERQRPVTLDAAHKGEQHPALALGAR